jgi:hypothetical protein
MTVDRQQTVITWPVKLAIILWMFATATVFVLISISPEGLVAAAMPQFALQAREALLSFFQAPALY